MHKTEYPAVSGGYLLPAGIMGVKMEATYERK